MTPHQNRKLLEQNLKSLNKLNMMQVAGQLTIKQITEKTKTRKSIKIPTANIDFTDNSQIKKYKKYTR